MEDILPTARWGNRMLRPLTSIYHRLEKYQETRCPEANRKRVNDGVGICAVQQPRSRSTRPDPLSDSEACGDDPSWIPGKIGKHQIKHKYTGRGEGGRGRTRMKSTLRSPETQKPLPGAIEIATPLITGKPTGRLFEDAKESVSPYLNHERLGMSLSPSPSKLQQSSPEKKGRFSRQSKLSERGSQWKEILDMCDEPEYSQIIRRLDRVFLNFLTSTRLFEPVAQKNSEKTRPLLSMVLRSLPHFISQEQQLQDSLDDDDLNMADVYFTQLEASYCFGNPAWPPLREAVRSQGIFLVLNMIQKHWITNPIVCSLVEKCIHSKEYDVAETLLSGQLLNIKRYDYPDSFDPWRPHELCSDPLMMLNKYWRSSGCISYVFNELAKLLLRGAVPAEWIITNPWKQCMDLATESISMEDGNSAAATRLIEAVILSGSGIFHGPDNPGLLAEPASSNCSSPRSIRSAKNDNGLRSDGGPCPLPIQYALNNLISSLITALCGMHFVRSYATTGNITASTTKMENLAKGLAIAVQREIGLRPFFQENKIFNFHSLRRGYALMGTYLLQCGHSPVLAAAEYSTDPTLTDNLEPFFKWLASQEECVKELASLVGQVVRCCKRGNEREQSLMSQHLCANLTKFGLYEMMNLSLFLGRVAVEVAMDFAQSSQDPEDHAWAADLQEKVAGYRRQYAVLNKAGSGFQRMERNTRPFRWEESISEWVASTPAPGMKTLLPLECLKPVVLIPKKLPSHAELSSSSDDLASSSSGDQASSVTSFVPSSLKRTSTDDDLYPKTEKRARVLRSLFRSGDNNRSSWDRRDDDTAGKVKGHNKAISLRRATGEYRSKSTSLQGACNGYTRRFSSSDTELKSNLSIIGNRDGRRDSGFEVVIFINRKSGLTPIKTADVGGYSLPPKPQMPKPPAASTAQLLSQCGRTVVPSSEDEESEDELCLF